MSTIDLTKLSGRDLFEYYTSRGGEYAQVLGLAFMEKGHDLFAMLEECERSGSGKHIVITDDREDIIDPPITVSVG